MNIAQVQVAIFYDVNSPIDFDGLSYFIRRDVKNIIGLELQNMQLFGVLPTDAPPEIPRLQLNSANNKLRVVSSLQRFDLFFERLDTDNEVKLDVFYTLLDKIFNIHESLNAKIIRVGLIALKTEVDDTPNITIANTNLNAKGVGDFSGLSDVHLMFNRRFVLEGLDFNCHLTLMPGTDLLRGRSLLVKQIDVSSFEDVIFYQKYNPDLIKKAFCEKIAEY
ncbi:hypothetical protein [Enterobacter sichuanensis]|uniref:hypothetical protein n=1 Tax=Enterobacter sichuanensis TaxID=2071710 RepID=UPI00375531F1|nr:hypothetical protein [Enterobacter roggenkampii]